MCFMRKSFFQPTGPGAGLLLPLLLMCSAAGYGQEDRPLKPIESPGVGGAYRQAEQFFRDGQYERSLNVCSLAVEDQLSDRIFNRFQALAARCCLRLHRRDEALRRVELIWQRDPTSADLSLVPLVWDDRVPAAERCSVSSAELTSSSPLRRLAAASSLLQDPRYTEDCVRVLTEIRGKRQPPLTVLAEAQLWRVKAPQTDAIPLPVVVRWQKRAATFSQSLRAGAQFVVGRACQLRHKPDMAVPELLWAPLMAPDDPVLASCGLAEAVVCLEMTGRVESAGRLRRELQHRYGQLSAGRRLEKLHEDSRDDAAETADESGENSGNN